jgi:2-polyprenyl-3-methyl-5-hydroxy-6-metoxy-1,4-benzoquinol methylase
MGGVSASQEKEKMNRAAVYIIERDGFKGIEGEAALRAARHILSHHGEALDLFDVHSDERMKAGDLQGSGYEVFILLDRNTFITAEGAATLAGIALDRGEFHCIVPVSNRSRVAEQRCDPPFLYQTLSVFGWAAGEICRKAGAGVVETAEIDDFCLAFRRETLKDLPGDLYLAALPQAAVEAGLKFGVAKGVYCHRYGNCYESAREDLLAYVPAGAVKVLDIGSARGLFGETLKRRQPCYVTGIDMDEESVEISRGRLDRAIQGDIEQIVGQGVLESYDCIVCGDVLEHLYNPWMVVKALRDHLKEGGLFIASTPNIMNWAVLQEQLKGRWDYIPFTILSGTHIRFFTKDTLIELFEDAGYAVKGVHLQSFGIPPQGVELFSRLRMVADGTDEEELAASEIVVVAER